MPLTNNEESSTLNPKSTAKNLEFKIVLDDLRGSDVYRNHDYQHHLAPEDKMRVLFLGSLTLYCKSFVNTSLLVFVDFETSLFAGNRG